MAYIYKWKMQMQVCLTYRFEVFASMITKLLLITANIFLWKCVYTQQGDISGINQNQMITYTVISACLSVMYQCGVQNTLNKDVREGNIATLLIKPYNLMGGYFAEDIGTIFVESFSVVLPILVICMLLFSVSAPVSFEAAVLFFLSYVLGFFILWFLSALVGMFTFVTMELGNMGVVKDMIVLILSGSMIPIWFFPKKVEEILMKTPFPYTYQTPLGLYIGKISLQEGLRQILIQIFWVIILAGILAVTWKKVQDKVLIQGG